MATVIAAVNTELAALIPASGSINGTQLQEDVASLLYLAQTSISDAVPAVWNGTQTTTSFVSEYTGQNLVNKMTTARAYVAAQAPAFSA